MFKKLFSLFAALTLSVGLWAIQAPAVNEQFVDATSGLKFEVTAVGEANTVKVIANDYEGTSYTIPATVKYKDVDFAVTEIGDEAFASCSGLTSVTIGNSVTTIGELAFEYCSGLTSVTIPNSVTTIGNEAFADCSGLTSVAIGNSVTTIGEGAFYGCYGLISVAIPNSVTTIEWGAFYECSGLTSVTFLGTACQNNIGGDAFYSVGDPDPALLTLPNSWTGTLPDEYGKWYGGKFELSKVPTALPTLFGANVDANKFLRNGNIIIERNGIRYTTTGQKVK